MGRGDLRVPRVRTFFASAGLHAGLAPDDPLGGNFAWLFFSAVQDVGCSIVKGGMHNVSRALAERDRRRHGGEIRTSAEVASIEIAAAALAGFRMKDGSPIAIDGPIAVNADPRHLVLDLLGEAAAGPRPDGTDRLYEWGPSFFVIYMALDPPVDYKAGPDPLKVCLPPRRRMLDRPSRGKLRRHPRRAARRSGRWSA